MNEFAPPACAGRLIHPRGRATRYSTYISSSTRTLCTRLLVHALLASRNKEYKSDSTKFHEQKAKEAREEIKELNEKFKKIVEDILEK